MKYIVRDQPGRQRVIEIIQRLGDKAWDIEIKPYSRKRSLPQNDRFHALIALIATETGNDPKWLKEWAKQEFGPMTGSELNGVRFVVPKPSSAYTVAEMNEVMNRLEAWAATELGISLGDD